MKRTTHIQAQCALPIKTKSTQHRLSWLKRTTQIVSIAGLTLAVSACSSDNLTARFGDQTVDTASADGSLITLADSLAAAGNHAAAIPLYRQSLKRSSIGDKALSGLGRSLMAVGQYDEAVDVLLKAANQRDATALGPLGTTYLILGYPRLAVENLRAAEGRGLTNPDLYSSLGVALDLTGDHDAAIEAYDRGLDTYSDSLDLRSNMALSMSLAGDNGGATSILSDVVQDPRSTTQHRQNLALAYVFDGNEAKARQMASIDMDPASADETIANFRMLKGLDHEERVTAMVYGMKNPAHDTEDVANQSYIEEDPAKLAAAERVVLEPEPEPMPEPEPAPEPMPEPVQMPDPVIPPLMEPEGWAVQIAAYRYAEEIMPGWEQLREKYADIIGHLEPRRSEIDFGDREEEPQGFFYRLNAGPLDSFGEALAICEEIVAMDNGECWIRPPEPTEGRLPDDE